MKDRGNALIIWRDRETGALKLAETSVVWCYPPRKLGECSEVGVSTGVDEVLDVTAENAAERVLCLAEPGRPRVGDRVSREWEPGQVGVVTELATRIVGVSKIGPDGTLETSCIVSIDRLTIEEG